MTIQAPSAQPLPEASLQPCVERACSRIAPTWPLDRFIAVNPLWGFVDRPLQEVSARMAALSGTRLLMPRSWFRAQWRAGVLRSEHLREAIASSGAQASEEQLVSLLERDEPRTRPRTRVTDVYEAMRELALPSSLRAYLVGRLSQLCARQFDLGQAPLGASRVAGLYQAFREELSNDAGVGLTLQLELGPLAEQLPTQPQQLLAQALEDLDVAPAQREAYLTSLLLDVQGWASWCAYRRWMARLEGRDDHQIVELLACRLAWEWLLLRAGGPALARRWQVAMAGWPALDLAASEAQADDWLLQRALELAYQQNLYTTLPRALQAPTPVEPAVQAVFCIDVRSEPYRRALEAQSERVQTLGFAGFFGLPIAYREVGAASQRPQLPGLLAPRVLATDSDVEEGLAEVRRERLSRGALWDALKRGPLSTFAFVETYGPLHAGKLLVDTLGWGSSSAARSPGLRAAEQRRRKPRLSHDAQGGPLTLQARVELAEGMLRAMGLTRDFARLVALVGHGSQTENNPLAAGLDCGACCGQTGEVNARAAAALLNAHEVRVGLALRGLAIPEDTRFVACLHDTTTDEVTVFERAAFPASHTRDLAQLDRWLASASQCARAARAPRLGVAGSARDEERAIFERARHWAELRPEWGLAGNAAMIVAPRAHTRQLDLGGRVFLHDYCWQDDPELARLTLIMTAPMVVAHWINFQYYASTVDNERYGSGNKVLHDVVGGGIGVLEGNGGDLRIGLPWQSLHDGTTFVHTPLRLSVFIEAPRDAIDTVLLQHKQVAALVDHQWLYLHQLDGHEGAVYARRCGGWHPVGRTAKP